MVKRLQVNKNLPKKIPSQKKYVKKSVKQYIYINLSDSQKLNVYNGGKKVIQKGSKTQYY